MREREVMKQMPQHGAHTRLATYGSLSPGRENHGQLSSLKGEWTTGTVRGRLFSEGWGAAMGYPGLILDATGDEIEVNVFRSDELPEHWARIDAFEGEGYRRVLATVQTHEGAVDAYIYVLSVTEPEAQQTTKE